MTVTTTPGGTMITGAHIPIARLIALKGMLKLESTGMRRRGKSARRIIADELGLPRSTGRDSLMHQLTKRIEKMQAEAT